MQSVNQKYGLLTVQYQDRVDVTGHSWYVTKCACGQETTKRLDAMQRQVKIGATPSCGCWTRALRKRPNMKLRTTYDVKNTAEYEIWGSMRKRCNNPKSISYPLYGGRGITVCTRWSDFFAFLSDVGPRPGPKYSLDRIDNDGNYEPGNVRWATPVEQAANRRGTKMSFELADQMRAKYRAGGVTKAALGKEYGIGASQAGLIISNRAWLKESS